MAFCLLENAKPLGNWGFFVGFGRKKTNPRGPLVAAVDLINLRQGGSIPPSRTKIMAP